MAGGLKPIGENGESSPQQLADLLMDTLQQSPALWTVEHSALLGQAFRTATQLPIHPGRLCSLLSAAPSSHLHALLHAELAAALAANEPDLARTLLAKATPPSTAGPDIAARHWGAQARALHTLGDADGCQHAMAQARQAVAKGGDPQPLAADCLAMGDFVGALAVVSTTQRIAAHHLESLYREIILQSLHADQLSVGLTVLALSDDMVMQHRLLRSLVDVPLRHKNGAAVHQMIDAAPVAYKGDLFAHVVPRLIEANLHADASAAVATWREVESTSLLCIAGEGLLGDPAPQLQQLHTALSHYLEEEEELGMVTSWAYRELGQAFGWLGDLGAALMALERVADPEERLASLLAASRHASTGVQEAFLCAAQGLIASLEDERRRVNALSQLAACLHDLKRPTRAQAALSEAQHIADGIRRARSDQGQTRRAALQTISNTQFAVNNPFGAYTTGRRLRTRHHQDPDLVRCATHYAAAGDLAGASRCITAIHAEPLRLSAISQATTAWLAAGRPLGVAEQDAA